MEAAAAHLHIPAVYINFPYGLDRTHPLIPFSCTLITPNGIASSGSA
jgi:hypothetical protein